MIKIAKETNPNLVNKKGTKSAQFSIQGVYKSGVGKPNHAALEFKKMLGL